MNIVVVVIVVGGGCFGGELWRFVVKLLLMSSRSGLFVASWLILILCVLVVWKLLRYLVQSSYSTLAENY